MLITRISIQKLLFSILLLSFPLHLAKAGHAADLAARSKFAASLVKSSVDKNVRAISYSGYRSGQAPAIKDPTYEEVKEDLLILAQHWNLIRLYGSGSHAETVLKVIRQEKLPMNVMLGIWLAAELNNPDCPWGKTYTSEELQQQRQANQQEVQRAIHLIKNYPEIITAINVGNEALVDWTDHLVPMSSMLEYVRQVKAELSIPVTVAENYVPWLNGLDELVELLDFITIHTYPIWEGKTIDEGLSYSKENYEAVARRHPNKIIAIGEAGWTTNSDNVQIPSSYANQVHQKRYFAEFSRWVEENQIVAFYFSAFDEDWKGGPNPAEPEKHWGLFTIDRKPKLAVQNLFPDL